MRHSRLGQRLFRTRAEDTLPVRVEHRRIYILPSARGVAFLCSLLLMLVASVNYSLSLGYALCFLLSGLFAVTLLHTYRNLAGAVLERVEAEPVFAGDRLTFLVTLADSDGRARRGLRLRARATRPVYADVDAAAERRVALSMPSERRGVQPLGRLTLDSDWPLGLWRAWSYVHAPCAALVFPRPENDPPPLPVEATGERAPGSRADTALHGDVAGLRPYVEGDSPTAIAWKSVARGQGLHVRLFDAESAPSRTRLTLGATDLSALEAQLSRLSAWVLAAEAKRADYAVELPASSLAPGHGDEQRREALTALAVHGT